MQEISQLIRWQNCLMASFGVVVGARVMGGEFPVTDLLLSATATFLVCAVGNIVNDILDIDIDRINRPDRVLPRGGMSVSHAAGIAMTFFMMSMALALTVSLFFFALALAVSGLLLLYNLHFKRWPIVGNAIIALMASLTLITGGMVVSPSRAVTVDGALLPALFAFLLHMVREIVKDVEDIKGDSRAGVATLAVHLGIRPSLCVALLFLIGLPVALFAEPVTRWFGDSLAAILAVGIGLPLAVLFALALKSPSASSLRRLSTGIKIGMAIGMLALLVRPQ
ncbi:MAG: geranylgeranylglycerol-phosphate geranylgeranyltransferase [Candidatus Zixiibacteriota bacterium]